ncbi:GAF and ANTAR domain-containing protein [Streptomyces chrestomyceticus]|uniref:GAF and ANTAR domain-containing protein n=1 Tax=Streptomyces chrestomyceticus TaxID=68185 RepID=UPI0037BCDF08
MTAPRPQAVVLAARHAVHSDPARRIGEACRSALLGAYAVGLTLAADAALAQRVSLCAAGRLAARGEALQLSLGEGPCIQALSQGARVLVSDLDDTDAIRPWPVYAGRAKASGIRAVFCLPVLSGLDPARRAGLVLSLYRDRPGPICEADLDLAQDHADAVDLLLLADPAPAGEEVASAWLLPTDAVIHQAVGMISYRYALTVGQALALLRAHAYTQGTDLASLAHAVVHEHLALPDPSPPGSGDS